MQTAITRARGAGTSPAPAAAAAAATPEAAAAVRWLTGAAAFGDDDGARVLALLADPSRSVRGIAISVAPLACDDPQATAALHAAWQIRGERRLLRKLSKAKRHPPIDDFLDALAADQQIRDLIDDLPFGSLACVRRHLPLALERPSRRFWTGLATAHPALLGELLLARWRAAAGEADAVTRQLTAAHLPRIADRAPAAAAPIAELLLARGIEPAELVWRALLRYRAAETVALAIRHTARVPRGALFSRLSRLPPELLAQAMSHDPALLGDFGPEVRTLSADRRAALATAWLAVAELVPIHGTYLLRHLPSGAARDRAFAAWSLAARDRDGAIPPAVLAELPIELAAREAARHIEDVVALATSPHRRLAGIARFLPWAALELAVRDHLGHPDGAMRAIAIRELIAHPGVYPDEPGLPARALALITARKFEQDPVRQVMLGELERWPRRVWRAEHLPVVAQIVRDALDASDLSLASATSAQRLIARLFGVDPGWAATWLATTIKERGALYDFNLGAKLTDDDLRIAAPQLVAIARTWATQERASWLIAFAAGLGPRLPIVAGLAETLARVRDAIAWEAFALQLTEVLARWAPALHAQTLPATLARFTKRKWHSALLQLARLDGLRGRAQPRRRNRRRGVLAPAISAALAELACRLDERDTPPALAMLRQRDPRAFDRVVSEIVPVDESVIVVPAVRTWLDRHRQDLLDGYIEGRTIRGTWSTGKSRWVMSFGAGFHRWSPAQCERHAAALDAIVGDTERDTPAVLAALITWPAITWASQARLIARASDERPVVREKAIRVLARCDAGQGVPTLLACLADDRARFAIYGLRRALFAMPPDRALALLADAPMRKLTVGKEVIRLTGELRAAGAFARLEELSRSDLHRDLRIALLRALWDHLDREPTWAIFERAVHDADWVVASRLADIPADRLTPALDDRLSALLAHVLARPEPEARLGLLDHTRWLRVVDRARALLAAILSRLASPFDAETASATAAMLARATETDLPMIGSAFTALVRDPRAFHAAADQLLAHELRSRASWRAIAAQVVTAGVADPRLTPIVLRVAARRALAADFVATLAGAPLDADALAAASAALPLLDPRELPATVAALVASPRAELRRLAVSALTLDAGAGRGWTDLRLAQLAQLRADPSPLVAGAAARLWPPREQDPGW